MSESKLIDLKSLLKLEPYTGEREKFLSYKWQLYVAVRVSNEGLLQRLKWIEKNTNKEYKLSALSPEENKMASEAYTILALTCSHGAPEFL